MRVIAAMRDPAERIRDFKEVNLGLTEEQAVAEASRCMYCGACVKGCPVGIDIPGFMKAVSERRFGDGIDIIKEYNVLPAVCGRVCPQENQCEKLCILAQKGGAVSIGAVERYLADNHDRREAPVIKENGKSAGVVGSGPAGLTAAFELRRAGFDVTVYEALHAAGGVLRYGIPEFRLPDDTVSAEAGFLEKMGVRFRLNFLVGKTLYIDELLETHDGIILSTGAGLPGRLGIPGENLVGVMLANEFLTRMNLMKAYRFPEYDTPVLRGENVVVIGGGNVAMDSARIARRLGAEVSIVYRRTEADMPARLEEKEHAKEEGIAFRTLSAPEAILGDERGRVRAITVETMETLGAGEDGRNRIRGTGEKSTLPCDTVIEAIGQSPNVIISENVKGLAFDKKGRVVVDKDMKTSMDRVWAAGDLVSGAATVILAMGDAKKAAASMIKKLGG